MVTMKKQGKPDPTAARSLAAELGRALPRLPKQLLRTDTLVREHHLPLSQLQLLLLLADGEASIGAISRSLGIAKPNVSPIVDALQQAGLIHRSRSEQDRRVVCVRLTEAGEAKVKAIHETLTEQAESWQQKLSPSQMREMQRALTSILELLQKLD